MMRGIIFYVFFFLFYKTFAQRVDTLFIIENYDAEDSLISREVNQDQELIERHIFIKDKRNDQNSTNISNDMQFIRDLINKYDSLTKETAFIVTEKIETQSAERFENSILYNHQGQKIKEITWNRHSVPNHKMEYMYDKNNRIIQIRTYLYWNEIGFKSQVEENRTYLNR